LGHNLGKNVVVEGVETQVQVELLMELRRDIAQETALAVPFR
jgi:EAL domain-containing protein (putative c-di-GMP-specific phosphodiesterase class I)